MRAALLCLMTLFALPARAQGTLVGHVRETTGLGIANAGVRIAGGELGAVTDANGAFRIPGIPAGVVKLSTRRIGFRPGTDEVTVVDGHTVDVTVVLAPTPVQLEQLTVTARHEPYDARLAGFRERSMNRVGTFITRDKIESRAAPSFSDLLREVPGVRIVGARSGIRNAVRFRGQNCPPLVFVDGVPASADEFDVDMINPVGVEGVEIYMSMLTVPAELTAPRGLDQCGVIAVWSRPFRPAPKAAKTVTPADLARMVELAAVFTADQVDTSARLERSSYTPLYPDSLWKAAAGGQATVEFVVDRYGRVEMETVSVVSASHALFGEAVRNALARSRFTPAVRSGLHVRQVVLLPTRFERPNP
jgi:TonB family protein